MAPVTEIVEVKLQSGITLADAEAVIRKLADATIATPGCSGFYTSLAHEDASILYMLIDWASIEAHQEMAKQDFYPALISGAVAACASAEVPPVSCHVALSPAFPSVLHNEGGKGKSAVTELLRIYFPVAGEMPQDVFEKEFRRFQSVLASTEVEGLTREMAWGWAVEEVQYKGEASRVLFIPIGWDSVAAHERFRASENYSKIVPILRGLPGVKGLENVHIVTKTW
ncbi:hypothetical protein GGR54DRAFT_135787 [Hypoxylon sp. NC1633]|nr:hypothetical protein GGR54DRAFT_135787 [Hypoxylon sp. NC1633]